MRRTWDWCMYTLVDHKVRDYLQTRVQRGMMIGGRQVICLIPETVSVIATAVGMSNSRVTGSLVRLSRKKRVSNVYGEYWQLNVAKPMHHPA